jgi:cytochrome P450
MIGRSERADATAPAEVRLSEETIADPYPLYEQWRQDASVQPVRFPSGLIVWQVTGGPEARAVLTDPRFSRSLRGLQRRGILGLGYAAGASMLTSDTPKHTRLRKLISRAFTTRRIEGLRPRVLEIAGEFLDEVGRHDVVDLVSTLAVPLPAAVVSELIGIPADHRDHFGRWTSTLVSTPTNPAEEEARRQAVLDQHEYCRGLIRSREAELGTNGVAEQPDLLSALLVAHGADRLSEPELLAMINLLVVAGQETTTNLISNGMLALLTHPDQRRLLVEQPDLIGNAVEELLRFDSPVQRTGMQVALEDVPVGGTVIPAGAAVVVLLAAANRDERDHPEAGQLDVRRGAKDHLALGFGPHYCLGAQLARMEGAVVLGGLLSRFPAMRLAEPVTAIRRGPSSLFVRGVLTLPVRPAG